jgi:hypothetical protein
MAQYKGQGDPDVDELVPYTPIVISGKMFNPAACAGGVHRDAADDGTLEDIPHTCVHDWRVYWGQQTRPV